MWFLIALNTTHNILFNAVVIIITFNNTNYHQTFI